MPADNCGRTTLPILNGRSGHRVTHFAESRGDPALNQALTKSPACDTGPAMLPFILTISLLIDAEETEFHELTGIVVEVTDGDTLTIRDREDIRHKIRLRDIDAPEKSQPFASQAQDALAAQVLGQGVAVVWWEKDSSGRIIGDVYRGSRCVNFWMVSDGLAWYRSDGAKSHVFLEVEKEARKARRGLWRDKNAEPPWKFSERQRDRKNG